MVYILLGYNSTRQNYNYKAKMPYTIQGSVLMVVEFHTASDEIQYSFTP